MASSSSVRLPHLLPFLFFFVSISIVSSLSSSPEEERSALLKIRSALIDPSRPGLDDWLPSSSHCSFSGVTCDTVTHYVVALNISFVRVDRPVPPEIGLFPYLTNLTISSCNFIGPLPSQLSSLASLRFINISNNNFSGPFPVDLPLSLPLLETFDAYNNLFSGPLPLSVTKLKRLRHLHLGGNFFSGSIPSSYSEIQSLEYLALSGNTLIGEIPASLGRLSKLTDLYLGYFNSYSGGIPLELGLLPNLRVLDMAYCHLTGEIPTSFSNLKKLITLFLQRNHLSGRIPPELSLMESMESLDLSNNEFTGEIPASFTEMKKLTLLQLLRNNLHGRIPAFIADMPHLQVLALFENNFTFELPEGLGRNGKLRVLDVATNHLTGMIPPDLCYGGVLESLVVLDNSLFGTIPEKLGDCKSLQRVRLAKNFFTGTVPAGLFNLPSANMIEMSDNFLSGELPAAMSGTVAVLSLANNDFSGRIPPAIGNLSGLQVISLEMNRFSGEIPMALGNLKQLTKLNLSGNNIVGPIPSSLSRCASLATMDVSRNNLKGEIPDALSKLPVLDTLNLSRNLLVGRIPSVMQSMQSLISFDVAYNDLAGLIPTGGQFVVFNASSFVGNPNLCGAPLVSPPSSACRAVDEARDSRKKLPLQLEIPMILILLAVGVSVAAAATVNARICISCARRGRPRAWKMTAFYQPTHFTSEDVVACIREENVIGKGGSGTVYRGQMPGSPPMEVAIKKLEGVTARDGDRGFSAEIRTLGKIRHKNIVRLLGYVSNEETKLLVYEYMANGSLGRRLHGGSGAGLGWEERYKVAQGAARGLCYLHHDCAPQIMHRDVKSNNILLDAFNEAHVADFGLAKLRRRGSGASESVSVIAGSYGYIAPEYGHTSHVNEKSDVYSFGVVLLELVTGRRPVGEEEFGAGVDIVSWVKATVDVEAFGSLPPDSAAAAVLAVLDRRLVGCPLQKVVHLFRLAIECVNERSDRRPSMKKVVDLLDKPPLSFDAVVRSPE